MPGGAGYGFLRAPIGCVFAEVGGYLLLRSNFKSHSDADVQASIAYGKRMKVYPFAQTANPPATVFTDVKDIVFDSTIRYDLSFFDHLDRIVQNEPWLDRDRAMIDLLKSLGIEKGKPFNANDAVQGAAHVRRARSRRGIRKEI